MKSVQRFAKMNDARTASADRAEAASARFFDNSIMVVLGAVILASIFVVLVNVSVVVSVVLLGAVSAANLRYCC